MCTTRSINASLDMSRTFSHPPQIRRRHCSSRLSAWYEDNVLARTDKFPWCFCASPSTFFCRTSASCSNPHPLVTCVIIFSRSSNRRSKTVGRHHRVPAACAGASGQPARLFASGQKAGLLRYSVRRGGTHDGIRPKIVPKSSSLKGAHVCHVTASIVL